MSLVQAPASVVMVLSHKFQSNPQTSSDNRFQSEHCYSADEFSALACAEFNGATEALENAGVTVHVFDDFGDRGTLDSVSPNNWFYTHAGGYIALYPMFVPNRRSERRWDVIGMLKRRYHVQDVIDFSGLEEDDLELTGSKGRVLAISARAVRCLTEDQKARMEKSAELLPIGIPTIEMAGGSMECMPDIVHLSPGNSTFLNRTGIPT